MSNNNDCKSIRFLEVYITTYNRAHYLRECIRSVLNQTYQEFDLYILDNCSTDNTKDVVNEFCDDRIHYICHEVNVGSFNNLNYAMTHASKDYFVIFHDDDLMKPTLLEQEITIMETYPDISIVSCLSANIDADGKLLQKKPNENDSIALFRNNELFAAYLNRQQYIVFPSIMYRTDFIRKKQICYDETVGPSFDIKMCFDITRYGGVVAIYNKILILFRRHDEQCSYLERTSMIVHLFQFLKNDEYYSNLLMLNKKGVDRYRHRMLYEEACLLVSKKISIQTAFQEFRQYIDELLGKRYEKIGCAIFIAIYSIMPHIIEFIYKQGKKIKRKGLDV